MKNRKLGIIGGSGLYKMEGFEKTKWKKISTPWGKPSDEILTAKLGKEEICFIPRHARGHKINPTNINFRANIDAMKQLGVTDIISVSAVGSLKEDLEPGKFVIVDQFIDRTFSRINHDEVDVSMVVQTLMKNASNAQNMIKEVIKTYKDFSVDEDPANNCLDVAVITDPKLRTKKTVKKLKNIAGRILNKK